MPLHDDEDGVTVVGALVMFHRFLPNALQYLLASYLLPSTPPPSRSLTFSLRHEYGQHNARPVFADTPTQLVQQTYSVETRDLKTHRPHSQHAFTSARMRGAVSDFGIWDEEDTIGPDVNNKDTLLMLAKMAANAYETGSSEKGWYNLGPEWNTVSARATHYGRLDIN